MAESKVRLPSGVEVVIKHKDKASEEDVLKFAFNEYVTNQDPGTKIGSSIAQGIDTLQQAYGSSLEGLGEILDAESLQQLGGDIVLENQAEIDARLFRESQAPTDQSQIAKGLDYVSELAGQSLPQMATSVGGAAIGGAIGTLGGPLAPLTIPAGAFLGGFISNMPYFYGSNRERQKDAIEKGYKTEIDEGAAMLAAIPQSSLDAIVSAVGAKFIATPAMKMGGGIFTKVAKGSAAGSLIEVPTEVGQTVLERAQAGLPLTGDEAFSEYIDAGVGGAVLGGLLGGGGAAVTSIGSDIKKDSAVGTGKTKKSDLNKEVEDRPALEIPRTVQVEYKELDGQVRVVPISITEGQDPMAVAEEALVGRYDPAYGVTVTDQSQPVGSEQELDLPDQAPEPTQEDVAVQPEAAVEQVPVEPEAAVPTPEQAPAEQVLPEVVPQVVPATGQAPEPAPAVRGNFRISRRMSQSKPRYSGQKVAYKSDLELAVYMAGGKGKNASRVRSELIEAGYSPAEINAMSEEVRAQLKKGYNPNSSKPISVAIAQDVTAEASGVDRLSMSFKDVTKRTPEIQEQAKILRENIKAGDREQSRAVAQAADEFKPVQSYDFVPAPESNSEMRNALSKDKVNKLNAPVKDGAPVAVRLDIPAYVSTGTWVPVVHEQTSSFRPGTPMSYQATAVVDGATLGIVSDVAVSGIAAGKAKSTIATIKGNLKKVTPTQAKKMADKALKDPSYIQVGMDPERRGYFYNRETMQEVVAGDQAIQIGPLVLVKNPQYGATPSNEWLSLGQDVVAEEGTGLTEQEIKDGQEGEQGLVADTPVTGDVVADAAQFKPSRPVSVPNAPVISRSSLRGKSGFIYFSDRTRVGTYTGLNSESGISIPLQGGMGYAFIPQNVEAEAGWAFTSDNIFTRFRDKVNETDGIGFVALYTKENLRANGTFLLAYIAEVNYALQSGKLTKADFKGEVNAMRKRFLAKKVKVKKTGKYKDFISKDVDWYSLWNKEWKTPEDLQAALDAAGFETRAAAFSAKKATTKSAKPGDLSGGQLASKRSVKKGMPDVIGMIDLFVEPDLADRKRGEIVGAVQFQKDQESAVVASDIGSDDHLSYPLVIRGRGIGVFDSTVNVLDVIKTQKAKNQALRSAETSFPVSKDVGEDVTAQAAQPEVEDRGPQDKFDNGGQVMDFVESTFNAVADKVGVSIRPAMGVDYTARYNATQQVIEYNPMALLNRSKSGVKAAMREEIIHAAMHQVLMQKQRKTGRGRNPGDVWVDFFEDFARTLTAQERVDIGDVYQSLTTYHALGAEYSRAVVQNLLYGEFSEQYVMESKGGAAWNRIVDLLRSVQAYMAKVLGPMIKTNPEAAQVIVDTVELLKAADPSIRPKSQDVVAEAYDATDKNTAKENTEAGERVGQDSSERIREERKWLDGAFRETASKYLTPVITRLNRINPMFGRILQNLDSAIRMRSIGYRKQTEMFFNKLNAIKGAEFQELKQLMFFSPTPEEANLPSNKAKMQRRDALLHKHGLLNMYRLDVQPILEEIYTEYNELGMPKIGYLEDYFPRVIKDLEGLIKSYGHKTKRTFELLVNEENIRRSELEEPLPEMQETERARFFQDFLQGKFRVDLNGVKLPGNVKAREIQLIPADKLKFYDNPGIAFGKYTTNMSRAIESFKVVGDTKKGEGRLLGELGKLTEQLFTAGQIDTADANELKSLTELITSQFQAENEILKSLGTLTYMATLINPGPVLVQIMDLYKVALYRGLGGVVSGTYRTVTGNRRFDIERDFGIAKTQLSAEFEDPSVLQKALDFGLSRLVPFRQMDTAMKHASIEAAYDDFVKKAKAPVGSKKHQQLIDYLTIKMGPEGARKAIDDLKLDRAAESTEIKEALLSELLERQPLTYLQVPEGYQTDPSKRLFYKLSTFMLLDLNYNRQEFMNDLGGPGKTLQQRTVALRRLAYMATLLTMFGLPSDLLDDWIAGKDTYIPEHVMNNMLGMFGLSRYTTSRALNKGAVESVIQRFTPPAINIMIDGEQSLRSWVKGDKELFEIKSWRNSPLSDVWYYRTGGGVESQRKYQKKQRKEGITPTFDR